MLSLEEAREKILNALPFPISERAALAQCAGQIITENVSAGVDLPPFDNSAMDGYAVRVSDVVKATSGAPIPLRLVGRIAAGENFSGEVKSCECVRVFTGSMIPAGADAVVMQEDTRTDSARPDEILVCDSAKSGENIRQAGTDIRRGEIIARSGESLSAARIALLAATGTREILISRRPIVALLATGSELRETGENLAPGQIYESNRAALAPLIAHAGGVPKIFPIVPDTLAATRTALEKAFAECDIVITSGGVSVGEMDFVKTAFQEMGGTLEFWKVAIRPGKPFVFGKCGGKFLFGLPGNPVSAFVTFLLLARPAILRWQGARETDLPSHQAVLVEPLVNRSDRRHFVRVRVDAAGKVSSAGLQASHALSSLALANGLVDVPPETSLPAGAMVKVLRWEI